MIVSEGKVVSFNKDGLVQAALQVAQLKRGYVSSDDEVSARDRPQRRRREAAEAAARPRAVQPVDGSQRIYLWFPTVKSMALLVVRTEITEGAAEALARAPHRLRRRPRHQRRRARRRVRRDARATTTRPPTVEHAMAASCSLLAGAARRLRAEHAPRPRPARGVDHRAAAGHAGDRLVPPGDAAAGHPAAARRPSVVAARRRRRRHAPAAARLPDRPTRSPSRRSRPASWSRRRRPTGTFAQSDRRRVSTTTGQGGSTASSASPSSAAEPRQRERPAGRHAGPVEPHRRRRTEPRRSRPTSSCTRRPALGGDRGGVYLVGLAWNDPVRGDLASSRPASACSPADPVAARPATTRSTPAPPPTRRRSPRCRSSATSPAASASTPAVTHRHLHGRDDRHAHATDSAACRSTWTQQHRHGVRRRRRRGHASAVTVAARRLRRGPARCATPPCRRTPDDATRTAPPAGTHARASVNLGIALAVLAVLLPLLLHAATSSPPTAAEFSPNAQQVIKKAPPGQAAPSTAPARATAPARGPRRRPRRRRRRKSRCRANQVKHCVGPPPLRQIEDPQSPPCIAYWKGDNGGATATGVTARQRLHRHPDAGERSRRSTPRWSTSSTSASSSTAASWSSSSAASERRRLGVSRTRRNQNADAALAAAGLRRHAASRSRRQFYRQNNGAYYMPEMALPLQDDRRRLLLALRQQVPQPLRAVPVPVPDGGRRGVRQHRRVGLQPARRPHRAVG